MIRTESETPEVARRAHASYLERLRAELEPAHLGEFVTINLETGEYEVDAEDVEASDRAAVRFGDAPTFTMRVGHDVAHAIGCGGWTGRNR